jgi:hypothetical protein
MATPLRAALDRAVAAGILTPEQAGAIVALDDGPGEPSPGSPHTVPGASSRGVVLSEVLGYVGGTLAVAAALFLGFELWDVLGPWPRTLLVAAVAVACLAGGAALGERDGAAGRLGGFLWAVAVAAVAGSAVLALYGPLGVALPTATLIATVAALASAVTLWWRRRAVLQHVAAFAAAAAIVPAVLGWLDSAGRADTFDWAGPLLWLLGVGWLAATATGRLAPATPGWVLGALAVVVGPLVAGTGRAAWLVVGVVGAAALVLVGVRGRRSWVAAVGTGGVFFGVPLAVSTLFDTELGPLIGILVAGLALVAVAVVSSRRATR